MNGHDVDVEAAIVELPTYRAGCRSCSWHGPWRDYSDEAQADALAHLRDVVKHPNP